MPTVTEVRLATLDDTLNVPSDQLGNAPSGGGGSGTVETVNGIAPDGSGNVQLAGGAITGALSSRTQTNTLQFGPNGATSQDGSYTRTNSTQQFVGDGSGTTLGQVYTVLTGPSGAQGAYPFASSLSQTVDYCAVQAGLNSLLPIGHGTLHVSPGNYKMGNPNLGVLVFPAVSGEGQVGLVGSNPSRLWPGYGATTTLDWSGSADATGNPHFTFAIDTTPTSRATIVGIAMKGPSVFASNSGRLPCVLAGIRAASRSLLYKVSMESFSTGIGWGGGTLGGFANTRGFDHSVAQEIWTNGVGYGMHYLPGSTSAGDQRLYELELAAQCASVAVASSASSGFVGTNWTGGGAYGAVGTYLYDDFAVTGIHGGAQVLGNTWDNVSHEFIFNASFYAQRRLNPGAGTYAKNHLNYLPQGPAVQNGWGTDVTISSAPAGATGNQITFTETNGVYWQLGMSVADSTNPGRIPVGTTVTAISAAWPTSTITMTLSNNLTADPTGDSVKVIQPKLGSIVAFNIHDNVAPTFSATGGAYPVYYVPQPNGSINDNTCWDVNQTLNAALVAPLTAGPAYGTSWGQPGGSAFLISGQMASGQTCVAGDMLMRDATGRFFLLADGVSRPAVGAAVLASTVSATGNVEACKLVSYPNNADVVVNNSSTGTLGAGALMKVDPAHPGKVTTASTMNDGDVVGYNDGGALTASTSGTPASLTCRG